jgi:hypothetical protein
VIRHQTTSPPTIAFSVRLRETGRALRRRCARQGAQRYWARLAVLQVRGHSGCLAGARPGWPAGQHLRRMGSHSASALRGASAARSQWRSARLDARRGRLGTALPFAVARGIRPLRLQNRCRNGHRHRQRVPDVPERMDSAWRVRSGWCGDRCGHHRRLAAVRGTQAAARASPALRCRLHGRKRR